MPVMRYLGRSHGETTAEPVGVAGQQPATKVEQATTTESVSESESSQQVMLDDARKP